DGPQLGWIGSAHDTRRDAGRQRAPRGGAFRCRPPASGSLSPAAAAMGPRRLRNLGLQLRRALPPLGQGRLCSQQSIVFVLVKPVLREIDVEQSDQVALLLVQ